MKRFKILSLAAAVLGASSTPLMAMTYFLQADLGVHNNQHLCRYSNGKVYSFNSTQLCELSIEDSSLSSGNSTGFKIGEYQDGMTKVCVYNVMGQKQALRIGSIELCPLSYNF
ncbi:hypothetical protein [Sphingobium fuliginis]|jgi:hypothetical protein|uniref:hypothetical protein n=1 Tax=Sphingobium fuliginis (strain ATCC 27551) TaxID=336203 RepID=UPI0037C79C62